jgi:hypothetical protein
MRLLLERVSTVAISMARTRNTLSGRLNGSSRKRGVEQGASRRPAMTPRDVIYDHLVKHPMRKDLSLLGISTEAVSALNAAGYVILPAADVEARQN